MVDFLKCAHETTKKGVEVYPLFIVKKSDDLMIRGKDFYAVWLEDKGMWSTDEQDVIQLVDDALDIYKEEHFPEQKATVKYMRVSKTRSIKDWHTYCKDDMRDHYRTLDEKLIFSNTKVKKTDYASKKLSYDLEKGDISAYDKLMSTLYSPEERHKIEWAIGSIVNGDSKKIQKFLVLYGSAGTGKSTVLNIIQWLFEGYYTVFDAKALGSSSNSFALEAFNTNPLVAIQHDGDLSRIEDNTRLNSVVSHELMTVNEKFKSTYANRFKCFLFMGTNKPVKITDSKSGLLRRLIDVTPSGNKLSTKEYNAIMKQIKFELGAIAWHCKEVYEENPGYYDSYVPRSMMSASNDFFNFMLDQYTEYEEAEYVTLQESWLEYKKYCEAANVSYPLSRMHFKEELKSYFKEFHERYQRKDGSRARSVYMGLRKERFVEEEKKDIPEPNIPKIDFREQASQFDILCSDCPAQYATSKETPSKKWDNVTTSLKDIDTMKLHYVKVPENHIVIDFDICDKDGNKCYDLNLAEASMWPPTYAELSKSGQGIHLHYIYNGDASQLSRVYDDHVEIKVFTGNSSLRRKLTKCNNLPIAPVTFALPLKGEKVVNQDVILTERGLRTLIKKNLNKEYFPSTSQSINFIYDALEKAYVGDTPYDVTDMRPAIISFASGSSNQAARCLKLVSQMKFNYDRISKEPILDGIPKIELDPSQFIFYDIEVFPNLLLVNWKKTGADSNVVRMINPSPEDIEELLRMPLVDFNGRRYDRHILHARSMGYSIPKCYELSQKIINSSKGDRDVFFGEAYGYGVTDVYDFASAGNKKSLKKLEIEMLNDEKFCAEHPEIKKISHMELGLPWDQPVPEEMWPKVAEYCDNDVLATELAFYYLKADWEARKILADLSGGTVNDTTNSLTTKLIFGKNRKPQGEFYYRNLAKPVKELPNDIFEFLRESKPNMMKQLHGEDKSYLPYFPGYTYDFGVSQYMDICESNPNPLYRSVGEGGFVYSEDGAYNNVALLDVNSMHPNSVISNCLLGPNYTKIFRDLVKARLYIKHEDWENASNIMDGKFIPYIEKVKNGVITSKDLANALKTAINSMYGLTAASFDNACRDPRNKDNIVAKYGALFMINLKNEVQKRGYTVVHIKTDSIKIADADMNIINFVMNYGEMYGFTFEHEATYDRMCLVNKAVYIARYATEQKCMELYGYCPGDNKKKSFKWTATGDQFSVPYIFKKLFSHDPLKFNDFCEVFSVSKGALYLDTNEELEDVSALEKELDKNETLFRKGKLSDTSIMDIRKELEPRIAEGHNLHFVGRVGQFCPIKPGCGGGVLYRVDNGKKYAAAGTTGYRWLESDMVKTLGMENNIDEGFYVNLLDKAVETIRKYTDFEMFTSDEETSIIDIPKYNFMNIPEDADEDDGVPFD